MIARCQLCRARYDSIPAKRVELNDAGVIDAHDQEAIEVPVSIRMPSYRGQCCVHVGEVPKAHCRRAAEGIGVAVEGPDVV